MQAGDHAQRPGPQRRFDPVESLCQVRQHGSEERAHQHVDLPTVEAQAVVAEYEVARVGDGDLQTPRLRQARQVGQRGGGDVGELTWHRDHRVRRAASPEVVPRVDQRIQHVLADGCGAERVLLAEPPGQVRVGQQVRAAVGGQDSARQAPVELQEVQTLGRAHPVQTPEHDRLRVTRRQREQVGVGNTVEPTRDVGVLQVAVVEQESARGHERRDHRFGGALIGGDL